MTLKESKLNVQGELNVLKANEQDRALLFKKKQQPTLFTHTPAFVLE
jgi:hypothetical protein